LTNEIAELERKETKGRTSKASNDRKRNIESKTRRLEGLDTVQRFRYSPEGKNLQNDKKQGFSALNHSEVIQMTATFLTEKDTLQKILIARYPILFIDESQDTNKKLMDAFLAVQEQNQRQFCLGLFGDTMQRIYLDGKEKLAEAIPHDWAKPEKTINHRCPKRIIQLINRIRQHADSHQQIPLNDAQDGVVRFFIVDSSSPRSIEDHIAEQMAVICADDDWKNQTDAYQKLLLEHQMAANRLGFGQMFSILNKVERLSTQLRDGTLAALNLFSDQVAPLVAAHKKNDKFAIANIMRNNSPLMNKDALAHADRDQTTHLEETQKAVLALSDLFSGSPTFKAVLKCVADTNLFPIPNALTPFVNDSEEEITEETTQDQALSEKEQELNAWRTFLSTEFKQIHTYHNYVNQKAGMSTHQSIKGREFPRVMVVMDDDEAKGGLFSYDKLFGVKSESDTDRKNAGEGKETTMDRTRRLFYVTCSRAEKSLALVLYSTAPEEIKKTLIEREWFTSEEIVHYQHRTE
jgi:DNA helicase-2/ATP-dependent DNA helicase PcrA